MKIVDIVINSFESSVLFAMQSVITSYLKDTCKYYERITIFCPVIMNLGIFDNSSHLSWNYES